MFVAAKQPLTPGVINTLKIKPGHFELIYLA